MVQPLTARNMLRVWEWGQSRHTLDRSLALLALALPDRGWEQLGQLTLGQRERHLLSLYQATFSSRLQGTTSCPGCGQQLDFFLDIGDVLPTQDNALVPTSLELWENDYHLRYRLPNSADLVAAVAAGNVPTARRILVRQCVIKCTRGKRSVPPSKLPAKIISRLADSMLSHDPQAELLLDFSCPDCHHSWCNLLDTNDFLWSAIGDRISQLLEDTHILAQAYGWNEAEIFSLSPARRQWYLRRVIT